MNYGRVAQNVRAAKQRYPDRYCKEPTCLRKVVGLDRLIIDGREVQNYAPRVDCPGGCCPGHQKMSQHAIGTAKHDEEKPKELYHD